MMDYFMVGGAMRATLKQFSKTNVTIPMTDIRDEYIEHDEGITLPPVMQQPQGPFGIKDATTRIAEAAEKIAGLVDAIQSKGLHVVTTTKTPWGEFIIVNTIKVAE